MSSRKYPCLKGECKLNKCRHFQNCDEVLTCFIELMPYDFIENQESIGLKYNSIKETEKELKQMREGYLNTHERVNLLGDEITSEADVYYNYNDRKLRTKLGYLKKELSSLRYVEFNLKKDWRSKILEESV